MTLPTGCWLLPMIVSTVMNAIVVYSTTATQVALLVTFFAHYPFLLYCFVLLVLLSILYA